MQTLAQEISKAETAEGCKCALAKCTQICFLFWFALIVCFWEVVERVY